MNGILLFGRHLRRANSLHEQLVRLLDTGFINSGLSTSTSFLNDFYPDSFPWLGMAGGKEPILDEAGNAYILEGLFLGEGERF